MKLMSESAAQNTMEIPQSRVARVENAGAQRADAIANSFSGFTNRARTVLNFALGAPEAVSEGFQAAAEVGEKNVDSATSWATEKKDEAVNWTIERKDQVVELTEQYVILPAVETAVTCVALVEFAGQQLKAGAIDVAERGKKNAVAAAQATLTAGRRSAGVLADVTVVPFIEGYAALAEEAASVPNASKSKFQEIKDRYTVWKTSLKADKLSKKKVNLQSKRDSSSPERARELQSQIDMLQQEIDIISEYGQGSAKLARERSSHYQELAQQRRDAVTTKMNPVRNFFARLRA